MANTERNAARLLAIAAAILFSTGGAGIKVQSFTAPQVSFVRSGIAVVVLLLWIRGRVAWHPAAIGAGIVYAATLSLFVGATKLTTAANAIFLQSVAPLYVLMLAPFLLHERAHRRDVVYLAALVGGMVLCFLGQPVVTSTASNPVLGNWLGAASGLAWALTLMTLRRIGRDDQAGTATVAAVIAGNAIACAAALPFALPIPAATGVEWATLVYLGIFQIGLAYVCLTKAIRGLPALDVSLLLLLEPVLNPLWTWAIRGEAPGGWTVAGGAVIIGATAIKAVTDAHRRDRPV
jgi:drug/metabolite transporter (DMT)-like permease